jgi:hypothetical protein
MTNHMCKYGRIRRINTAYTSIKPYSAYQLSPYRIRYGDVKFRRIRRINTIYNTGRVPHSTKVLCHRVHPQSNTVPLGTIPLQHHKLGNSDVQAAVIWAENELLHLHQNVRSSHPGKVVSGCGSLHHTVSGNEFPRGRKEQPCCR